MENNAFFLEKMSKKSDADMYINNVEFSACSNTAQHSTAHHSSTTHHNTTQHSTPTHSLLSFVRACLEFLTTLTFRALYENHIVSVPFETIVKNTKKSDALFSLILDSYVFFVYFLHLPDTIGQFKT